MKKLVILGAGTAGTIMANKLTTALDANEWQITIVDQDEFIEMVHDAGAKLYACKATVEMFHLTKADFCEQVEDIINVGTFYEKSAGAQIIFT